MTARKFTAASGVTLLLSLGLFSCASILDIKEAKHDPTIENDGDGGRSGAGDDGGAGGPGEGGGGGAPTGPVTCDEYCDTVQSNCIGPFEVYTSRDICLGVCALLELGERDDDKVNTIGCRLRRAQDAAKFEPEASCSAAGPGGNGACGTNCEGFCAIALQACSAEFITNTQCLGACTKLEDLETYNDSMQSGGHVQCRLYHASVATDDPTVHCPHTAGARPCVPPAQ